MKTRTLLIAFAVLTVLNIIIFLNRKHFEYRSYPSLTALYSHCDKKCIEKWDDYMEDFPAHEQGLAEKILAPVLPGDPSSSASEISRVAAFLRGQFSKQGGRPSDSLLSLHPVEQYNLLLNNRNEQIWCGNWSNIFAYFCWTRGIPTRIIEIMKPGDHHVVNECYLREDSAWALVDLTNNLIMPRSDNGNYHTVISYIQTGKDGNYEPGHPLHYYYRYNLQMVYSSASRLKRYMTSDPWYGIVDPGNPARGNTLFYIKIILLYLWLLAGLVSLGHFSMKRFGLRP